MRKLRRLKNQSALARALRVSRETVSQYVKAGLRPEADGTYDLDKGREWAAQAAVRMKAGTFRTGEGSIFDTRYRRAKALKMEKELAESLGQLVSRSEVQRQWATRLLEVRDAFMFVGQELAGQCVGLSAFQIRAIIDRKIFAILGRLAQDEAAENTSPNASV